MMDSASIIFQRMCRSCMMQDQNFYSIYENAENHIQICEMLATVAPQLLIHSSNQLPQQLCVACLNKLNIAYSFQQMCIASEKQLLNILCADSVLITNELPFTATSAMGRDPLLVEQLPKYTICIKSEENEDPEDVKDIVVEEYALSAQHLDVSNMGVESQPEECCAANTNIESSGSDENEEKYEDKVLQKTSRISDTHNKTGVNESEKPRNHSWENLACPHCYKVFDRVYNLERHVLTHNKKGRFNIQPLKECEAPKTREKIRKRPPPPPPDGFKCPECTRRFEKGQSLAAHMHVVHRKTVDIQTFKCRESEI